MLYLLLLSAALVLTSAAPSADLVSNLPGLNFAVNYNQYSGYLDSTSGRHLHYWFFESQNDPANDPLILWLNGGPGCSSLLGLLTELGPFYVDQAGSGDLHPNPYSWNTFANIVFLESPACIGFSYDENDICDSSDDSTSLQNYIALQSFFTKFPEYSSNEFFITGESYGGIYIPTLVERVIDGNTTYPMNLQGFAIGNGCFDDESTENGLMLFGYYHGIFGDTLWNKMIQTCCQGGVANKDSCTFYQTSDSECLNHVTQAYARLYYSGLNPYNLYSQCNGAESQLVQKSLRHISKRLGLSGLPVKPADTLDPDTYDPACSNNDPEINYLNSADVKTALHIQAGIQDWSPCSGIPYTEQYSSVVDKIAYDASHVRALIFNGDVDMVCNYMGNEWPVEGLGLTVSEDYREWFHNGQVAGFVKRFANLDYLTVKGSGHMVPGYEPEASLHMIKSFIENTPY